MKVNLNGTGGRVPYALIEVVSIVISDDVDHQGIVLSMEEDVPNFNSTRNKGTVLALVGLDALQGANYHYSLVGQGTKALTYGSLENVILTVTNTAAGSVVINSLDAISILFKISYPRPNEIQDTFSTQIPLPSRV
jgi:hypothetical protein